MAQSIAMSDSAFKELSIAEKLYKSLIWDTTITAALTAAESYITFLMVPGIKQAFEGTVHMVGDWIFEKMRLVTDLAAIKLVNSEHQAAFDAASVKLKVIIHDKGIDSPEFKKAREDAKLALARFVHSNV